MHRRARGAGLYFRVSQISCADTKENNPSELHSVLSAELIDPTGAVYNLLLAGVERVA